MEEYREIPNYSNYMISNFGNLKNKKTNRILRQWIAGNGYKYCRIINNDGHKKITIHSLITKIFLGEKPDNYEIDHIDRNKLNNSIENLRYVSKKDNCLNKNIETKKRKNSKNEHHHIILNKWNSYQLSIQCKYIGSYKSLEEAIKKRDEIISNYNI